MQRIFLILITLASISCSNQALKEKELELRERELKLKEQELAQKKQDSLFPAQDSKPQVSYTSPKTYTKFIYIIVETKEPSVQQVENEKDDIDRSFEGVGVTITPKYRKVVNYKNYTYISDVIEIENYSEDKKNKELDKFESSVKRDLDMVNFQVKNELAGEKDGFLLEAIVLSRKAHVFNSYSEASEAKRKRR